MPFALVIIGLMMIVTGAKDTFDQMGAQLQKDFTGEQNFTTWLVAIFGVGAVGYVKELEPISRLFMGLIIITMVIRNGGFFDKFQQALAQGPATLQHGTNETPSPTDALTRFAAAVASGNPAAILGSGSDIATAGAAFTKNEKAKEDIGKLNFAFQAMAKVGEFLSGMFGGTAY